MASGTTACLTRPRQMKVEAGWRNEECFSVVVQLTNLTKWQWPSLSFRMFQFAKLHSLPHKWKGTQIPTTKANETTNDGYKPYRDAYSHSDTSFPNGPIYNFPFGLPVVPRLPPCAHYPYVTVCCAPVFHLHRFFSVNCNLKRNMKLSSGRNLICSSIL